MLSESETVSATMGELAASACAELFDAYGVKLERSPVTGTRVDRAGWGHVAFQVPDVPAALDAVVATGGSRFGEVVTLTTSDGRHVTWCYAADPDGNIIELQAWS